MKLTSEAKAINIHCRLMTTPAKALATARAKVQAKAPVRAPVKAQATMSEHTFAMSDKVVRQGMQRDTLADNISL